MSGGVFQLLVFSECEKQRLLLFHSISHGYDVAKLWTQINHTIRPSKEWMHDVMGSQAYDHYKWALENGYVSFVEDMEPIDCDLKEWHLPYMAHRAIYGSKITNELMAYRRQRLSRILEIVPQLDPVRTLFWPLLIGNESDPLPKIENN
jgi:hypothetical protein